jgi:hypothetical protein
VKGSKDIFHNIKATHITSAWANTNQLVLGQVKADNKSNEITAISILLDLLDIGGCIITIDALRTRREIAAKKIEKKADYLLALKVNQGTLKDDVEDLFRIRKPEDKANTLEKK